MIASALPSACTELPSACTELPSACTDAEPLRVVHLAYSLRTGGMERLLVEFARRTDRSRFDPRFLSLTDRGTPADDIEAQGCPVVCFHKGGGFRWRTVWQLAQYFRREKIRVVHTHNSGAMIYGALAARLAGVPVVVHTRHGQRFGATSRQTWVFAQVSRWVDRVVGVSQDSARQCRADGVALRRIRTIWNGIDLERFAATESSPDGAAILVARLVPEKDLPTLLQAVELVLRHDPTFQLKIVGDGPSRAAAEEIVAKRGLSANVEFLGERRDVPQLLQQASLFVLSSRTEGISLTLLEAMACGLPIIATRVGGNGEVVEHNSTGWLVPAGDAQKLADAIERLWADRDLARQWGEAGRRRVETYFDVDRMVHEYETLYREVLAEKHHKTV